MRETPMAREGEEGVRMARMGGGGRGRGEGEEGSTYILICSQE